MWSVIAVKSANPERTMLAFVNPAKRIAVEDLSWHGADCVANNEAGLMARYDPDEDEVYLCIRNN